MLALHHLALVLTYRTDCKWRGPGWKLWPLLTKGLLTHWLRILCLLLSRCCSLHCTETALNTVTAELFIVQSMEWLSVLISLALSEVLCTAELETLFPWLLGPSMATIIPQLPQLCPLPFICQGILLSLALKCWNFGFHCFSVSCLSPGKFTHFYDLITNVLISQKCWPAA